MDKPKTEPHLDGALIVDEEAVREPDLAGPEGEPSEKAETAAEYVQELLDRMGLETSVVIRGDEDLIVLDVQGVDAGRAIGKKGQTLDALQFLVNKVVNRFPEGRRHVIVDCGDYRERHEDGLVSLAHREAKRAVQQGRVVTLQPMTPRDRRVIHLSLAKFEGVTTRSDGEGAQRRIQIIPSRASREAGW